MLSDIKDIKVTNDPLVPELIRDIVLVPEDAGNDLPAITISGAYLKREKFRSILKPLMGKGEPDDKDEIRFRDAIVQTCWRGWSGVTLRNLVRVSEYIMLNFDALKAAFAEKGADENTPISFDVVDAKWVAAKLNNEVHQKLVDALCKMEEYAAERLAVEKKD